MRWSLPAVLTLWCMALLVLRVERSGSLRYLFLSWNLILAWIPCLAGQAFRAASQRGGSRVLRLGWFGLWLLFLPNAPYIVTDLLHLAARPRIPLWYDLALLFSFAGTGLLLGYISLLDVQSAVEERLGRTTGWTVAVVSLFMSGFGIYLGRFLRRNSWEVLTDPSGLFLDIADRLLNPASHPRACAVTLIFGLGLLLGYVALRMLAAPVRCQASRLGRRRSHHCR
jgi:uncharacterized membrane protein